MDSLTDTIAALSPDSETFAVEVVDFLLEHAESCGASDLHLNPESDGLRAVIRRDGVLSEAARGIPHGDRVVSRIKVLAALLTYRTDIPQEGRLRDRGDVRVACGPTVRGEKAVLRWPMPSETASTMDGLGLPAAVDQTWRSLLGVSQGLLLITGPAGAGKTTTAYASLQHVMAECLDDIAVCTLEDPVERVLPGVSQTQTSPEFGNFAGGLRALLRHDPDVLFVGEIRDRDTVDTAMRAALTGHLVISTMHAGSAAEAVTRLFEMDFEPYLIASSLIGVLNQRLLRTTCRPCDGAGCEHCRTTGYSGRAVVGEILDVRQEAVRDQLQQRPRTSQLRSMTGKPRMLTVAKSLLEAGRTTERELLRVFGELEQVD